MCVAPRLGTSFLKTLFCFGLLGCLFPFRQHKTVNVSLLGSEITRRLLKNEIRACPSGVHLKSKYSMLQEVYGAELFTFYFAFLERSLPFFSECLVNDD